LQLRLILVALSALGLRLLALIALSGGLVALATLEADGLARVLG
jgi:hypothetical protein